MLSSVMSKLEPGVNTYKCFTYLGRFPSPNIPLFSKYEAPKTSFQAYFDDFDWFVKEAADLVVAKNTLETLDISVRKMDNPVTREYLKCPLFPEALKIVSSRFATGLTQPSMSIEEVFQSMEMDKATGYVLRQSGYKKKYQVVANSIYIDFLNANIMEEIPIWLACGKEREYLYRIDYIGAKKQRTFIVEPFELLFHHKLIYGHQSEGMKGVWWSAYGINPYEGGANRLARRLLKHKRKTMGDVVRYDRLFPHMREVFEIKNQFLADNPFMKWVTDNCCTSRVVLPNGDFIEKSWGNNSGSGSTTIDNIIGMAIVIVHAALRLGVTDEELDDLVDSILFGDDFVIGDSLNISDALWESNLRETFDLYGFKFDPLIISNNIEDMSFLGFGFKEWNGSYIPRYELGVLAFGYVHSHDNIDKIAEISKFGSLLLMSAGLGEVIFNKFRNELINCLSNFNDKRVMFLKANDFAGVPTFDQTINWYLGHESMNGSFFNFLTTDIF